MSRHTCVFWNVQRLFDPSGLPVARELGAVGDAWTREDYDRKVRNVAGCLRALTDGETPGILALAEVESTRVLLDLRDALGWDDLVVVDESRPDPSIDGLDVAVLLDRRLFDLRTLRSTSIALDNRFSTRDLVDVRARTTGGVEMSILVAHWPSRLISEGESLRFAYSVYLSQLLATRLKFSKSELVRSDGTVEMPEPSALLDRWRRPCVVVGDFNDEPFDPSVREALNSTRYASVVRRRGALKGKALQEADNYLEKKFSLFNPCWDLTFADDGARGGTYYRGEWRAYDQLLTSHGLLDEDAPVRFVEGSVRVGRADPIVHGDTVAAAMAKSSGAPRSFDKSNLTGVSDHYPLLFDLEF